VSAGAYISDESNAPEDIFTKSRCDMIFALNPDTQKNKWKLSIFANTALGKQVKTFVLDSINKSKQSIIEL